MSAAEAHARLRRGGHNGEPPLMETLENMKRALGAELNPGPRPESTSGLRPFSDDHTKYKKHILRNLNLKDSARGPGPGVIKFRTSGPTV